MRVTVLGAGVVGVATAWYLAADGHEVTVIERRDGPAQEASFANGGQISVSHAEPWANPEAILAAVGALGKEDAPLLWRFRADPEQWLWGLRFLRECTGARTRRNIAAIVRLGLSSRSALQALRADLGLEYEHLERGILHFYTCEREFAAALPKAAWMREFGCARVPRTAAECLAIEPALARSRVAIVGGTYTAADESGDAQRFSAVLAEHAVQAGVVFRFGQTVAGLEQRGGRLTSVRLATGEVLTSDATVLALGCHSPRLLQPLGIDLPVYPAKGYSATFKLTGDAEMEQSAPRVSLTDDGHKIVFSRLGQRLRVAGTAEFTGYDDSLNATRCKALADRALQIFPVLAQVEQVEFWAGLRPATPSNVPFISDMAGSGLAGLWLNTGHGTLGWTLACGSARLLANLMAGREPDMNPAPYRF